MSIWQSDTWQWWLEHGFDGIGAGVIGGVVAGLAVRATIRHERKLGDQQRTDDEMRELRERVSQLRGAAFTATVALESIMKGESEELMAAVFSHLFDVRARAARVAPGLDANLKVFEAGLMVCIAPDRIPGEDPTALRSLLSKLHAQAGQWITNPEHWETSGVARSTELKREVAERLRAGREGAD